CMREVHQLARVIPAPVADDDLGHVRGVDGEQLELVGQGSPVLGTGHLEVILLLPAGIVENDLLSTLDDADVDGQVDRVDVVRLAVASGNESAVGHERAEGYAHEPATLDE